MVQQSDNRKSGDRFERRVFDQIEGGCLFAARFGETSSNKSTPDMMCVYSRRQNNPKLRLVEAKENGYIRNKQREELLTLAEKLPEWAQLEVAYKRSKYERGKAHRSVLKKAGEVGEEAKGRAARRFEDKVHRNKNYLDG